MATTAVPGMASTVGPAMASTRGLVTASIGDKRRRRLRDLGCPLRLRCLLSRPQINLQSGRRLLWRLRDLLLRPEEIRHPLPTRDRLSDLLLGWRCPNRQPRWDPRRRQGRRARSCGAYSRRLDGRRRQRGRRYWRREHGQGRHRDRGRLRKCFRNFRLDDDGLGFQWFFDRNRGRLRDHTLWSSLPYLNDGFPSRDYWRRQWWGGWRLRHGRRHRHALRYGWLHCRNDGSWNRDGRLGDGQLGHQSARLSHIGWGGAPFDGGSDVAGN